MKIVGFNFNKISVEKTSDNYKDLKINTKIDVTEVKQIKSEVFQSKENLIEVKFNYSITYSPKIAEVSFSGAMLTLVDDKTAKEFIKSWKKKQFPEEHKIPLFNVILKKSNLKALELEDELNLPLHIPLPTVKETK
ncbi:MAG: hypothetical protein WDZ77_00865 [Candidatus Pacearchaeota archaeon]